MHAQASERSTLATVRDGVLKYGFLAVTVILFIYFAFSEPTFRTSTSFFSCLKSASVVDILGVGVTFTMVVGGIDLSLGSVAGMSVTLAAMTMVFYAKTGPVAIGVVLIAGALVGLVNALLIVWLKIPDLLATLAMMFIIQGLKLVPVSGQSVSSGMILQDGTIRSEEHTSELQSR